MYNCKPHLIAIAEAMLTILLCWRVCDGIVPALGSGNVAKQVRTGFRVEVKEFTCQVKHVFIIIKYVLRYLKLANLGLCIKYKIFMEALYELLTKGPKFRGNSAGVEPRSSELKASTRDHLTTTCTAIEPFSRRRWTTILTPSVSYSVHEDKCFWFQV